MQLKMNLIAKTEMTSDCQTHRYRQAESSSNSMAEQTMELWEVYHA